MRYLMLCLALGALAACGADGEPVRPAPKPPESATGVRISGSGGFGVAVTRGGTDSAVRRPVD